MNRPDRKRKRRERQVVEPPEELDLEALAAQATYRGSPKHKDAPVDGVRPAPRIDASICPQEIGIEGATEWLREAIRRGNAGAWTGSFPAPVWHRDGDQLYEAHLTRPNFGEYHGFPLEPDEEVRKLK